jgi:hypothetical protein
MRRRIGVIGAGLALAFGLAGCEGTTPKTDPNVCYQVVFQKDQTLKYVVVAKDVPTLEDCAGKLEGIRITFLRMGGSIKEITGAYADQFLFLDPSGIYASKSLTGPRYTFMGRNYDGRLVRPGAANTIPAPPQIPGGTSGQ